MNKDPTANGNPLGGLQKRRRTRTPIRGIKRPMQAQRTDGRMDTELSQGAGTVWAKSMSGTLELVGVRLGVELG